MRLVALFPLLFTTSSDVLCLNFGGVWETLWIFKGARWTHYRCTKINKSPTVSSVIRASSFDIWTAKLAQSLTMGTLTNSWSFIFGDSNWKFCSQLPCRHPKPRHSDEDISELGFFFRMLLFLREKNQNLLGIQEHCICKLGKIWSELKLLFGVYYWSLKLYTGIIWHSYFPPHGILLRKGSGWSGAKWVNLVQLSHNSKQSKCNFLSESADPPHPCGGSNTHFFLSSVMHQDPLSQCFLHLSNVHLPWQVCLFVSCHTHYTQKHAPTHKHTNMIKIRRDFITHWGILLLKVHCC